MVYPCQRDRQYGGIGAILWAEGIRKLGHSEQNLMKDDKESGVYKDPDGAHGRVIQRRCI